MLTIEQFKEKYPGAFCWGTFNTTPFYPGIRFISEGFLQFTAETAFRWAGPFEGGHAQFVLRDYSKAEGNRGKDKGKNLLVLWDEGNLERKAACKRRGEHYSVYNDRPTLELPVELKMYGNDDTSYSKFYKNEQEALNELQLFITNQPLDFDEVISDFKFYFTN
jgi:hypothetical protein